MEAGLNQALDRLGGLAMENQTHETTLTEVEAMIEALLTELRAAEDPATRGADQARLAESFLRAVQRCWALDAASEAARITVTLGISLTPEGRVESAPRFIMASDGSDVARSEAFDAARRAILRCGAGGYDLPAEAYDQWREIEITFDPSRR